MFRKSIQVDSILWSKLHVLRVPDEIKMNFNSVLQLIIQIPFLKIWRV